MNIFKYILSSQTRTSLYNFFKKNQLELNENELETLYQYIKKNQNLITNRNYQEYLYDSKLNLDLKCKQRIDQILKRFC